MNEQGQNSQPSTLASASKFALSAGMLTFIVFGLPVCYVVGELTLRHSSTYHYASGHLTTGVGWFFTGPFKYASLGTLDLSRHSFAARPRVGAFRERPLPRLYLHVPQGDPISLEGYTEAKFVERFGKTRSSSRIGGYRYGRMGDAELGFDGGLLKSVTLRVGRGDSDQGWPCLAKSAEGRKVCLPLSKREAEYLLGGPIDRTVSSRMH